jgi:hypothetical protein
LWPSYEGANKWKCCALVPKTEVNKKEAQKSIRYVLSAFEARMSLIMHKVGAVGMTDEAAAGYYLVKWLSEPYTLHADTKGMSGIISSGKMVVDVLYFNPVHHTHPATVSHYDSRGGKAYLSDWLASAANQCDKCTTMCMRKSRGNAEEGCEGIVFGP